MTKTLKSEQKFLDLYCPLCKSPVYKTRKVWESNYLTQQFRCSKCNERTTNPLQNNGRPICFHLGEKRPDNKWEQEIRLQVLRNHGEYHRNGYPDVLAKINGHIIAVEVKPSHKTEMRQSQKEVMELFNSVSILCYKWNPQEGYVALFPDTPSIDDILTKE